MRPEEGSGLIVLAMGKMGAGELNYSSDIDLIVFFDPAATSLAEDIEPQPFFVRVTQALARLLQQRTGDGYVFRVDLRLRPDPASTPGGDLDRRGAALLRAGRADLGTRRHDQGAALRRRPQGRRGAARGNRAVRLAQASGFRGARRRPRHEAADADLSRPERDRGRGPQRQGRPRRHPRDRVLRPDPAIDRRRPASGIAGAADAGSARMCWRRATGSPFEARDELTAAYEFLRRVEHRLQMVARRADPYAARRGRGGGALCRFLRL